MNRSPNITRFGIHMFVPFSREDRVPFGFSRILGSGGLDLSGEIISLQGGSSRYPYANSPGYIEPTMTISFKEAPSFLYQLALGTTPVILDSSAARVADIKNEKGTSIYNTSGKTTVSGITISDAGNAKFGKYTLRFKRRTQAYTTEGTTKVGTGKVYLDGSGNITSASASNTFAGYNEGAEVDVNTSIDVTVIEMDVHVSSDIQASDGTEIMSIFDDLLKINEDSILVEAGESVDINSIGITVAFDTLEDTGFVVGDIEDGDSASFDLYPQADFIRETIIGRPSDNFPEFGAYMLTENSGGRFTFIEAYRCKLNGMPMSITEKTYAEAEIAAKLIADGERGIARIVDLVKTR